MAQPEIEDDGRHDWVPDASQVNSCDLEYVSKMKTRHEEERARRKQEIHEREKARRAAAARPNLTPDGFRIESESARHERALHMALQEEGASSDSEGEPAFERAISAEDWIERRIAGRADDSSTIAAGKPRSAVAGEARSPRRARPERERAIAHVFCYVALLRRRGAALEGALDACFEEERADECADDGPDGIDPPTAGERRPPADAAHKRRDEPRREVARWVEARAGCGAGEDDEAREQRADENGRGARRDCVVARVRQREHAGTSAAVAHLDRRAASALGAAGGAPPKRMMSGTAGRGAAPTSPSWSSVAGVAPASWPATYRGSAPGSRGARRARAKPRG